MAGFGRRDDLGAFGLGDTRFAARPRQAGQAVDPLGGESAKTAPHRGWMAAHPRGDHWDVQPLPAQGDDGGSLDPVGRGMPGPGQPADLVLFPIVSRWPGA